MPSPNGQGYGHIAITGLLYSLYLVLQSTRWNSRKLRDENRRICDAFQPPASHIFSFAIFSQGSLSFSLRDSRVKRRHDSST